MTACVIFHLGDILLTTLVFFSVFQDQTSELINEYVIPGCSYRIEVISQPDNDVDLPYVNFNVPGKLGCKFTETH